MLQQAGLATMISKESDEIDKVDSLLTLDGLKYYMIRTRRDDKMDYNKARNRIAQTFERENRSYRPRRN